MFESQMQRVGKKHIIRFKFSGSNVASTIQLSIEDASQALKEK